MVRSARARYNFGGYKLCPIPTIIFLEGINCFSMILLSGYNSIASIRGGSRVLQGGAPERA